MVGLVTSDSSGYLRDFVWRLASKSLSLVFVLECREMGKGKGNRSLQRSSLSECSTVDCSTGTFVYGVTTIIIFRDRQP